MVSGGARVEQLATVGGGPSPRFAHAACVVGDSMLVHGGFGAVDSRWVPNVHVHMHVHVAMRVHMPRGGGSFAFCP